MIHRIKQGFTILRNRIAWFILPRPQKRFIGIYHRHQIQEKKISEIDRIVQFYIENNESLDSFLDLTPQEKKFVRYSFAQEGEDQILNAFFENNPPGFFVDVGAYHPYRFSNTYVLYKQGWRGINIDPTPGFKDIFKKERAEDITLEIGISENFENKTFYQFNDPALNTFDSARADHLIEMTAYRLTNTVSVMTKPLKDVLEEHAKERSIEFMSIDVEKHEIAVLRSNDWSRFRPYLLLIELFDTDLEDYKKNKVHTFLEKNSYRLIAKTMRTCFYIDTKR